MASSLLRQEVKFVEDDADAANGRMRRVVGHTDRESRRVSKPIVQARQKRTSPS